MLWALAGLACAVTAVFWPEVSGIAVPKSCSQSESRRSS